MKKTVLVSTFLAACLGRNSVSAGTEVLLAQADVGASPSTVTQQYPWPTKAALLEAVRAGQLVSVPRPIDSRGPQATTVVRSVTRILQQEYGVPVIAQSSSCYREYEDMVKLVVRNVTLTFTETLVDSPPYFYRGSNAGAALQDLTDRLQQAGGWCDNVQTGPHPYKPALMQLMNEYGAATKVFVEGRRTQMKEAYALAQANADEGRRAEAAANSQRAVQALEQEQRQVREAQAAKDVARAGQDRVLSEVKAGKRKPANCDQLMATRGFDKDALRTQVAVPAHAIPKGLGQYVGVVEQMNGAALVLNMAAALGPLAGMLAGTTHTVLQTGRDTYTFNGEKIRIGTFVDGYAEQTGTRNITLANGRVMTVAVLRAVCLATS